MPDDPENLILVYLRRMDSKLDRLADELGDVKLRLQALESGFLEVRRDVVSLHADLVRIDHRLDRVEERLARVERRFDLAEA